MPNFFKLNGIDGLEKALKSKSGLKTARAIVKLHTINMANTTQRNMTQYKKPTGATKRSTISKFRNGGMTGYVAPSTEYFPYVELGTRFMAAEPTLKPAFDQEQPEYIKDLRRLVD